MKYTVRQATSADEETIRRLNTDLFREEYETKHDDALDLAWPDSGTGREYYRRALSDPQKVVLLATATDGNVGGYLIGSFRQKYDYRKVRVGELENMLVSKPLRRRHIGRMLVEEFLLRCRTKGIARVYVSAYAANEAAVSFYASVGFAMLDVGMEISV